MKILMIAPCPYNLNNIKGGVEAVTVNLLHGFKEINEIEMLIVSIRKEIQKEEIVEYSKNIQIQYIPYGKIKSTKMEMLFHGRKRVKDIVDIFQPDIIHIQGNGSILFLTIGLNKSKLIVTQHGILWQEFKQQKTVIGKLSYFINVLTEKSFSRNIKNYIFISDYNKKLYQNINRLKQYNKIYNPVNPIFFKTALKNTPENRLLYIGGIMKRKGLIDLLRVISKLKDEGIEFTLDVIGGTIEKKYRYEIEDYVKKNEIEHIIEFHEWVAQDNILDIITEADVLILPSYQETLPVTIAEAMAAGKIVIATNVGGISEMIEDGVTGFLYDRGNINQLESILIKIQDDMLLQKKISLSARNRAKNMFNPKSVAEQTIKFYKEVIK